MRKNLVCLIRGHNTEDVFYDEEVCVKCNRFISFCYYCHAQVNHANGCKSNKTRPSIDADFY